MRGHPAPGRQRHTVRTSATALFFSGNPLIQYNAVLRDQVSPRQMDIVAAARMFAAVDMSQADTLISVWQAKYLYGFWRPITAITLGLTLTGTRPPLLTRPGSRW